MIAIQSMFTSNIIPIFINFYEHIILLDVNQNDNNE